MNTYYVIHSGVPGQRQGERNGPPYPLPAAIRAKLAARAANDDKKQDSKKKSESVLSGVKKNVRRLYETYKEKRDANPVKNVKNMSDAELREWLNRYDMEQKYLKINSPKQSSVIKTGKEIVGEALKTFGKTSLTNLATRYANELTKAKPENSHKLLSGDASKMSDDELKKANQRRAAENLHIEQLAKEQEKKRQAAEARAEEERYQAWLRSRSGLHHSMFVYRTK